MKISHRYFNGQSVYEMWIGIIYDCRLLHVEYRTEGNVATVESFKGSPTRMRAMFVENHGELPNIRQTGAIGLESSTSRLPAFPAGPLSHWQGL